MQFTKDLKKGKTARYYAIMYNAARAGEPENWVPCCLGKDHYRALFTDYEDALEVYKRVEDKERHLFMIGQMEFNWTQASR